MLKKFFAVCFALMFALALTTGCPEKSATSVPTEITSETTQPSGADTNAASETPVLEAPAPATPDTPAVGGLSTEDNSEAN
ncbi:MAG: hypothetical protein LBJ67_04925 [Planctomycetaceae bacterium]|nr:hypothetical protein [Planctomycetaceae bacterium]